MPSDVAREEKENKTHHMPFTDEKMEKLWANVDIPFVDALLIQCYYGWRPSELGYIKFADVDLEARTFKDGIKTETGKNRIVPIHSKI